MSIKNKINLWLKNEKKEIMSILKAFWIEHEMTDLLIISLFLILIFLVGYQAYHETTQSHISFNEYVQLKKTFNELMLTNKAQEETLKEQHKTMTQMAAMLKHRGVDPVTGSILIFLGVGAGMFLSAIIMVIEASMK